MPDFYQPGPVISLPLLTRGAGHLEADLSSWARDRPLAVLLPCHVRDLDGPALTPIIATLAEAPWVSKIVIGLDGAGEDHHVTAQRMFRAAGPRCEVLHHGVPTETGKGRNLALCTAQVLQRDDIFAVAMHDCDIRHYSREFLARLCWPVLHPDAGLRACKGYYARSAGGLHGRVFRLLFQPLVRAWAELFPSPWTSFLQSFRYPLSGELCVEAALLKELVFDPGWGVEVRLLHSLFRAAAPGSVCQAELCDAYDHKHQEADNLIVMAAELAQTLRHTMQEEGATLDDSQLAALGKTFGRHVARALRDSSLTAQLNNLPMDESAESHLSSRFLAAAFSAPPAERLTP